MLYFYVPIAYSIRTRFNTWPKAIGWFFTYLFPVGLLFFILPMEYDILTKIALFVIAVLAVYTVYEIGYIENDTETIKSEKNPSLRLGEEDFVYYEMNKIKIYLFRVLLLFVFIYILHVLSNSNAFYFTISMALLLLLFKLYNGVRNRLNLFIQFFLSSIRYFSIMLLLLDKSHYVYLMIFLLTFPLLNFIEWTTKKRFFITFMSDFNDRIDALRVVYYLIILIVGIIFFKNNLFFSEYLVLVSYYLIYRTLTYFLTKKMIGKRKYK